MHAFGHPHGAHVGTVANPHGGSIHAFGHPHGAHVGTVGNPHGGRIGPQGHGVRQRRGRHGARIRSVDETPQGRSFLRWRQTVHHSFATPTVPYRRAELYQPLAEGPAIPEAKTQATSSSLATVHLRDGITHDGGGCQQVMGIIDPR